MEHAIFVNPTFTNQTEIAVKMDFTTKEVPANLSLQN